MSVSEVELPCGHVADESSLEWMTWGDRAGHVIGRVPVCDECRWMEAEDDVAEIFGSGEVATIVGLAKAALVDWQHRDDGTGWAEGRVGGLLDALTVIAATNCRPDVPEAVVRDIVGWLVRGWRS